MIYYATHFCAYILTTDFVVVKQLMMGLKHGIANGRNFEPFVHIVLRFLELIDTTGEGRLTGAISRVLVYHATRFCAYQ